ncbi:MAG: [NiFe]-hydrogenase assembly chaperone HybE [Gammaproteobacteria bacterium]|nr:[NiFe]-hydrogenase assembly chaperone HybE [Gammaproteobacteria bacterium]
MINPEYLTSSLEDVFTQIQHNQMKGIPILNQALKVEAVGFQPWGNRCVGILITPWFMNLMLLPCEGDDWDEQKVGSKLSQKFPARAYEMTVNEFDGIGRCLTYPLHSPMNEFDTHPVAVAVAEAFMEVLMIEVEEQEPSEEEVRMARFLEGEDMQAIADDEPLANVDEQCQCPEMKREADQTISRRDLLRGSFLNA